MDEDEPITIESMFNISDEWWEDSGAVVPPPRTPPPNVYKTIPVIEFYNTHMTRSISHLFLMYYAVPFAMPKAISVMFVDKLDAIALFIKHDEIIPNLMTSSMYVHHLAAATYFKNPSIEGIEMARKYLTDFMAVETNKSKKYRAMLMLAEFDVINKEYQRATDTLMNIIAQAKLLSPVRGLAYLALLKVLAVYKNRICDAYIAMTQECNIEIAGICKLYPYMDSIYHSIAGYIRYKHPMHINWIKEYNKDFITSIKSHKSDKVFLALGHMYANASDPGNKLYESIMYYYQSACYGNCGAMNIIVEHWIENHYNTTRCNCTCHMGSVDYVSTIMWFILTLLGRTCPFNRDTSCWATAGVLGDSTIVPDSRFEPVFINAASMCVVPYIYEYKRITCIISSDDKAPQYRGADKIAHNMDLLAKQRTYLTNYKNPNIQFCDICLTDNTTCYTYACGIHAFCASCTANISKTVSLRKCPKCQIPEHPYFKDIWKIKKHAVYDVAINSRRLPGAEAV